MAHNKSLNRYKEAVFSIFSLAAVVLIVVAVVLIQGNFDLKKFGVSDSIAKSAADIIEPIFSVSDKFKPLSPAEDYAEGRLYEKINGKAPLYTDAGFKRLQTQRFSYLPNPDSWIEIYRFEMTSPKSAYTVYSSQKRAGSDAVAGIGADYAYQTSSGIFIAAENLYFEITASVEDQALIEDLTLALPELIDIDNVKFMSLPAFLPDQSAVDGSFKLYIDSAFGVSGLGDVYARNYSIDEAELMAFVIDGEYAQVYKDFLVNNGAQKLDTKDGIEIYDFYGVYELIALKGDKFAAVREADDKDAAYKLLKMIIEKIND